MPTRRAAVLLAAVIATTLVSCSAAPNSLPAPGQSVDSGEGTTEGATVPEPAGPAAVDVGESFDVIGKTGATLATVKITGIEVDLNCSAAGQFTGGEIPKPTNGHFVAIAMDVGTTADHTDELTYPTAYDFTVTGPDGYTTGDVYTSEGDFCLADRERFGAATFVPSSKYRGWLLLDSPAAEGTLTFRPHFLTASPGVTVKFPIQ